MSENNVVDFLSARAKRNLKKVHGLAVLYEMNRGVSAALSFEQQSVHRVRVQPASDLHREIDELNYALLLIEERIERLREDAATVKKRANEIQALLNS